MRVGAPQAGSALIPSFFPPKKTHLVPVQVRTNVPSWCDRILWKSYPETHVNCNAYGEGGGQGTGAGDRPPPAGPGHPSCPLLPQGARTTS